MSEVKRHIVLDGICNLRDLGGYQAAGGSTRWRRILRSDSLHDLRDRGMDALVEAGLSKVVDLRDASEVIYQPSPFNAHRSVDYAHVPLFAHLDLQAHLSRAAGANDVLLQLYCEVLTQRQSALAEALSAIASAKPGAVLFHCTVGKDRSGVLAALVLGAVGVNPDDIVADYALTTGRIDRIQQGMLTKLTASGIEAESLLPLFSSAPSTMHGMLDFLDNRYGGIDAYLHILDPDRMLREKLRQRMLC